MRQLWKITQNDNTKTKSQNQKHFVLKNTWRLFTFKKMHHFQSTFNPQWLRFFISFSFSFALVYLMHVFVYDRQMVYLSRNIQRMQKVLCTLCSLITRQLYSMAHVILFAPNPCTCPKSNCFYHKYNCRQVFPCDFPSATWNCE